MEQPSFTPLADSAKLWGITAEGPEQLNANRRRTAVDLLRLFLANRTPITLWGPPGARKTRTIQALCFDRDERGTPYQVITIQPSTQDPTVIHGMMYTSLDSSTGETVMRRSIPDIAQQIIAYNKDRDGLTILFMDEMTTCMPAQQHALLGILTHGRYGDMDISDLISVVMAANPETTVSTVNPLGEQVINRGGHIPWYGDLQLFLDEWSTGFNNPDLVPDRETEWYTRTLLHQAPEKAFRSPDRWSPDELVPYDLMEHTERVVTELAGMVKLVNITFASAADSIRHWYIVEVTRALLGNDWAERMAAVTAMEGSRISSATVLQAVRKHGVTEEWSLDKLTGAVGEGLHRRTTGAPLTQDQVTTIAEELVHRVRGPVLDRDAYLGLWVFVMTTPTTGTRAGLHRYLLEAMREAMKLAQQGEMSKTQFCPQFVDADVKADLLKSLRS